MGSTLSEEQEMLLDASTRLIDDLCPLSVVRAGTGTEADFVTKYHGLSAQLGWYSMLVAEERGGGSLSGNGMVDATLIAYRRGQHLQPGPFIGTNVVAYALAELGDDAPADVLSRLIDGQDTATWVLGALGAHGGEEVRLTGDPSGLVLSGRATFVQDAGIASWLLVTARADDGGLAQVLIESGTPGVEVTPHTGLDVTRRFCDVDFHDVPVPPSARLTDPSLDGSLVDRQLAIALVLTAAESVGAMDRDLAMAVQYAKDRIAFGRPIGSFQAIKHLLADTSLALEMSKAVTMAAADAFDGGTFGLTAASMAKAYVADAGIDLAQNCFQVFGGIGYTWEHDQHLFLRRLTTDAAIYGDSTWHRERVCALADLGEGSTS